MRYILCCFYILCILLFAKNSYCLAPQPDFFYIKAWSSNPAFLKKWDTELICAMQGFGVGLIGDLLKIIRVPDLHLLKDLHSRERPAIKQAAFKRLRQLIESEKRASEDLQNRFLTSEIPHAIVEHLVFKGYCELEINRARQELQSLKARLEQDRENIKPYVFSMIQQALDLLAMGKNNFSATSFDFLGITVQAVSNPMLAQFVAGLESPWGPVTSVGLFTDNFQGLENSA